MLTSSVAMGQPTVPIPAATTGHFYLAQTGHFHVAATKPGLIISNYVKSPRSRPLAPLPRLAKEVQMWRHVAPLLLDRLVPTGAPIDEGDPMRS